MGPLSEHMATHLMTMAVMAPAAAHLIRRLPTADGASRGGMAAATVVQLGLLWGWHAPAAFAVAVGSLLMQAIMHISLIAAAVWFWFEVLGAAKRVSWASLVALLVTGKFVCLMGLLLALSPRAIYSDDVLLHICFGLGILRQPLASFLNDQQMAGVLMLTVCPVAYVSTAIVFSKRLLQHTAQRQWLPGAAEAEA